MTSGLAHLAILQHPGKDTANEQLFQKPLNRHPSSTLYLQQVKARNLSNLLSWVVRAAPKMARPKCKAPKGTAAQKPDANTTQHACSAKKKWELTFSKTKQKNMKKTNVWAYPIALDFLGGQPRLSKDMKNQDRAMTHCVALFPR